MRSGYPIRAEINFLSKDVRAVTETTAIAKFRGFDTNRLFGGIHNRLYLLGAQPGTGKSSLFLQWADELAEDGHFVLFANLEMPRAELVKKSLSRIGGSQLTLAEFARAPKEALEEAVAKYRKTIAPNIMFINEPVTPMDLSIYAGKVQSELDKTPIIFVDYVQIMPPSGEKNYLEERSAIKETVAGLRKIVNGHNCPVFAISSIRRQDYSKKTAGLDALAEAQSLEYGADVVSFLTEDKDDIFSRQDSDEHKVTLSVVKNRYGATGSITLRFNTSHASFSEMW